MLRRSVLGALGGLLALLAGCTADSRSEGIKHARELTVAVTTSTYDAGVLDPLHEAFEERFGVRVRTVAGGTGENLRTGERGDVDCVMAHAPPLEAAFLESGHGINRRNFVRGDFVIAGPAEDPAGISEGSSDPSGSRTASGDDGVEDAATAFARIAEREATFVSRGDDSGTHVQERAVWEAAGIDPDGEWYLETGQGMGDTLVAADRRDAYLLTVRGNYHRMRDRLALESFVEGPITGGDPSLDNPYGIIAVNPAIHQDVDYQLAMSYIGFLTSPEGQVIVREHTVDGQRPFLPAALSEEPDFGQYRGGRDQ
ncbi:substrate-binding domain-containing protein [Halalkalicoccus salilacus]|uniref:substrate-binding domain-containing protein n=1 Tax=Halalkalicoccus salilacus TaxID=3117459 RepID=UPI00300E6EC8